MLSSQRSISATTAIGEYPNCSLKTLRKTSRIELSLFAAFESAFESILNKATSVGTLVALLMASAK